GAPGTSVPAPGPPARAGAPAGKAGPRLPRERRHGALGEGGSWDRRTSAHLLSEDGRTGRSGRLANNLRREPVPGLSSPGRRGCRRLSRGACRSADDTHGAGRYSKIRLTIAYWTRSEFSAIPIFSRMRVR